MCTAKQYLAMECHSLWLL